MTGGDEKLKKTIILALVFSVVSLAQTTMQVTIPSPAKTILNLFGLAKERVTIFNPTPFTTSISALGKPVGSIPPGGFAWGTHSVKFDGEQYPFVGWMLDATGRRIGVAFGAPNFRENQLGEWIVTQVYYPDGRYSLYNYYGVSPYGAPDLPKDKEIDFPGTSLGTTVYVQFINCTYFAVEAKLGTGHSVHVSSMEDITLPYENVLQVNGTIPVKFVYSDRGREVGWSGSSFSVWTNNTPRAVQILLTPSIIRNTY